MAEYKEHDIRKSEGVIAVRSIILGAAAGIIVCALLLCALSALIVKIGTLPADILPVLTTAVGAFGSFAGGYFSVSMYRRRGLVTGLATGALMFASIFITSVISGTTDDVAGTLIKCGVYMLLGSIGGVVRVNKRQKVLRWYRILLLFHGSLRPR